MASASHAPTLTVDVADRPPSSDALDGARFAPGAMLAGRYRIVGLLGLGGMGEVYRAEDLKLGQPVALKFLPADVVHRADRLARFHQEVRLAREVSHPNVCRVHDIAEADGLHFLSMEYIDGENLASLLRRIGRLPQDKAIEIARQLCAGLAAAHDRGVLHRDLKPANVLIDGRGRARLVDFGLADLAATPSDARILAGTPGYMAPEQIARQAITTKTDVYALGLVLYEMFTGRRAVEGVAPSTVVPDLDPAIERVILRCLERDPARRPPSALAVAVALPGSNLLAAAIARGETPSPDMVAAAGETGIMSPAIGAACLAGVVAGLFLLAPFARDISLIGLTTIEMSPQALTERAHAVLRDLGYTQPPAEEAVGYASDLDYLQYIDEHDRSPDRWRALATSQPAALVFWYRQSPQPLVPVGGAFVVSRQNPPPTRSGMVSLTLDQKGRLVSLLAIPAQAGAARDLRADGSVDWTTLFADAGLPQSRFSAAEPRWTPPVYAEARAAWAGAYPDRPDVPIRVEAASAFGKAVSFEIVAPWTRPTNDDPQSHTSSGDRVGITIQNVIQPVAFFLTLLMVWWNLRPGRGDRRGATRLSLFVLVAGVVSNALAVGDVKVITRGPPSIFYVAAGVWVIYIAIEPHVRRIWPEVMFGWSRLLAGSLRDPLVGRDVLAGVLLAIGNAFALALHSRLRQWLGEPPGFPAGASSDGSVGIAASSDLLLGGRHAFSRIIGTTVRIPVVIETMTVFLMLLVLYVLLRRRWMAVAALIAASTAVYVRAHTGWMLVGVRAVEILPPSAADVALFLVVQTAIVLVAVRFGLLTMIVGSFVTVLLTLLPLTIDSTAPYAFSSYLIAATVVALAAYGSFTAIGGRSAVGA